MTRGQAFAAAAVLEVLAWVTHRVTGVILVTLGIGVISLITVHVHPRVRHVGWRGCGGTGEHRGAIFAWRHRRCARCNSGRLISYGAGHFGAGHIQAEYERANRARAAAREQNRWR